MYVPPQAASTTTRRSPPPPTLPLFSSIQLSTPSSPPSSCLSFVQQPNSCPIIHCESPPIVDHDAMRCAREDVKGISINHSHSRVSLSTVRIKRLRRVSMSGQIALSTNVGASTSTQAQERTVLPPPSAVSPELCKTNEKHEGQPNGHGHRREVAKGAVAPKLLVPPDRHDANAVDDTRNSPPHEYPANEKPDEDNHSAAASGQEHALIPSTNLGLQNPSVASELSTMANDNDSAPLTDNLFTTSCMESPATPSSPSKKKKKNKKKKVCSILFPRSPRSNSMAIFTVPLIPCYPHSLCNSEAQI